MKRIMQINQEILEREKVVVWKGGLNTQKIMCELIQQNVKIDAFCGDVVDFPELLGKKVVSVDELVTWPSYALLVSAKQYDDILDVYKKRGLKDENVFVWIDVQEEVIYI